MNKVLNIEEIHDFIDEYYCGYKVTTEKFDAYILIEDYQKCCENFGYLSSDDPLGLFIGKDLKDISIVDKSLKKTRLKLEELEFGYQGGCMFVNLEFFDGSELQLTVYNFHNAYYGHDVLFMIDDKVIKRDVI